MTSYPCLFSVFGMFRGHEYCEPIDHGTAEDTEKEESDHLSVVRLLSQTRNAKHTALRRCIGTKPVERGIGVIEELDTDTVRCRNDFVKLAHFGGLEIVQMKREPQVRNRCGALS